MRKLSFNITPRIVEQHAGDMVDVALVDEVHSTRQGAYVFAYTHYCQSASTKAGQSRYHSVVEIWDVRDPSVPYFVSAVITPSHDQDHHYSANMARERALSDLMAITEDMDDADLPVGGFVKAVVRADYDAEKRAEAFKEAMSQMAEAIDALGALAADIDDKLALGDDDDDDDALPGAFSGFNPFGD